MVKQLHFNDINKVVLDLLGNSESLATCWWNSPNKAFKNITPFEEYKNNPQNVLDYLVQHLQY
jgi:hypothetical protein